MLRSTSYPRIEHRIKCLAPHGMVQRNHPGTGRDVHCVRSKRSVGTYPAERLLLSPLDLPERQPVVLCSRARETSAGGGRGCQSFEKGKARSQRSHAHTPTTAHESSTDAFSACWKPRHWRQRTCPSSADRKRPQPEGHGWNGILKKTRPSVICSFRICSFSWSAQWNRCWEGLRWLHRDANQEQIRDERLVEISTLLIHSITSWSLKLAPW